MIPRRSRDLPFGRSSSLFSYKRRYNGNLCAHSVQQAKAAASTMTCTLSAPAAYFLSTATKSMQKAPFETDGFKTSFTFKSCVRYGPSRELTQQQTRCRSHSGEENITFTAGEYGFPRSVCGLSAPSCPGFQPRCGVKIGTLS